MIDKTYQDGWEVIPFTQVHDSLRETVTPGKECDRLSDILNDLLQGTLRVKWFFSEVHYRDKNVDHESIQELMHSIDFHTVYDSSWLSDIPESGYNCISIRAPMGDGSGHGDIIIALSCNGDMGSSALTEYFRFSL